MSTKPLLTVEEEGARARTFGFIGVTAVGDIITNFWVLYCHVVKFKLRELSVSRNTDLLNLAHAQQPLLAHQALLEEVKGAVVECWKVELPFQRQDGEEIPLRAEHHVQVVRTHSDKFRLVHVGGGVDGMLWYFLDYRLLTLPPVVRSGMLPTLGVNYVGHLFLWGELKATGVLAACVLHEVH